LNEFNKLLQKLDPDASWRSSFSMLTLLSGNAAYWAASVWD
jgi:hypothetical protein